MTVVDLQRDLDAALGVLDRAELPALAAVCTATLAKVMALLATPPASEPAALVDAAGLARILDVPVNWVRDRTRAGAVPCDRLGHYVRYSVPDVLAAVRRGVSKVQDQQSRRVDIPKRNQRSNRAGVPVPAEDAA